MQPTSPLPPFAPGVTFALAEGVHYLERSSTYEIKMLVKASVRALPGSLTWPIPCARSYEGYPWEVVVPREGSVLVEVSCTTQEVRCNVTIPHDPFNVYFIKSTDLTAKYGPAGLSSQAYDDRAASQFFMQATFGPTRSRIANMSSLVQEAEVVGSSGQRRKLSPGADAPSRRGQHTYKQWILDQMAVEPTLHRAYLRKHANLVLDAMTEAGRTRRACEVGSRWSSIAIRVDDRGAKVQFSNVSGVIGMYVGGVLRSEVDIDQARPYGGFAQAQHQTGALLLDKDYLICWMQPWRYGKIILGSRCVGDLGQQAIDPVDLWNFHMRFSVLSYPSIDFMGLTIEMQNVDASTATLTTLPVSTPSNEGVKLLSALHVPCPFSSGAELRSSTTIVYEGVHYRYDPRLVMLENSLDKPTDYSSLNVGDHALMCGSVTKTFLNEHTCKIVPTTCSFVEPRAGIKVHTAAKFQLNDTTLRMMFIESHNFAYAIDGLPLQGDPCSSSGARWRSLIGPCSLYEGASPFDSVTTASIVEAIRGASDPNAFVRDVTLNQSARATCSTNVDRSGAQIEVDGNCWKQTNPRTLDVYDFTLFATGSAHPGNNIETGFWPIKQPAYNNETRIIFAHTDSRFDSASTITNFRVGKLGDWVDFSDLPLSLQSTGLATGLGLTLEPEQIAVATEEVCGSPGEVAQDPFVGAPFYFGKTRYRQVAVYSQLEVLQNSDNNHPKSQIFMMAALHAPDELRQRVAWALASVVIVAVKDSVFLGDHSEVWTMYYDIFVRHAFGSYRDVLREGELAVHVIA